MIKKPWLLLPVLYGLSLAALTVSVVLLFFASHQDAVDAVESTHLSARELSEPEMNHTTSVKYLAKIGKQLIQKKWSKPPACEPRGPGHLWFL